MEVIADAVAFEAVPSFEVVAFDEAKCWLGTTPVYELLVAYVIPPQAVSVQALEDVVATTGVDFVLEPPHTLMVWPVVKLSHLMSGLSMLSISTVDCVPAAIEEQVSPATTLWVVVSPGQTPPVVVAEGVEDVIDGVEVGVTSHSPELFLVMLLAQVLVEVGGVTHSPCELVVIPLAHTAVVVTTH